MIGEGTKKLDWAEEERRACGVYLFAHITSAESSGRGAGL
jgi:hypothetical protein